MKTMMLAECAQAKRCHHGKNKRWEVKETEAFAAPEFKGSFYFVEKSTPKNKSRITLICVIQTIVVSTSRSGRIALHLLLH